MNPQNSIASKTHGIYRPERIMHLHGDLRTGKALRNKRNDLRLSIR